MAIRSCWFVSFLCYLVSFWRSLAQIGAQGWLHPGTGCPGVCGVSIVVLSHLLQLPLLWAGGSGETIPRGAFQPHPSMILWKTRKGSKKSPERQRGSQWLLFRVSCHVFPPSALQQEQEQSQFCVSALCHTRLCHSQCSWGARSEK